MSLGDLITITTKGQQIETNGLLLGRNTNYGFASLQGLGPAPIRGFDSDLATDGTFSARDEYGPRLINARINMKGTSESTLSTRYAALVAALPKTSVDIPLAFRLCAMFGNTTYKIGARRRKLEWTYTTEISHGFLARIDVQWYCADPTIYTLADVATAF